MSIRVTGSFNLDALKRRVEAARPEAEHAGAEIVLEEARKGVGVGPPRPPGESMELATKGEVTNVESGAEIRFPGPYAAYLEERLDLHHPGGGHPKYLSGALESKKDDALEAAARKIREAL